MRHHPVLDVLRDRLDAGTGPGNRADDYRLALAVEGGGSRATYSSGMVLALEELGMARCFDAVYGSSAGALAGSWLVAGLAAECCAGWWRPGLMDRVTNVRRGLRGRPVIDVDYLIHTVGEDMIPVDWDAVVRAEVGLHPLATDVESGEAVDLHPTITDKVALQRALQASACVPVLAGLPVEIDGRRYVDAAVAEPIPFHTALAQRATHVLVLRTRRADQEAADATRLERAVVARLGARRVPGLVQVIGSRLERRRADDIRLAALTAEPPDEGPQLFEVRPPDEAARVHPLETEPEKLHQAVMVGREALLGAVGTASFPTTAASPESV